MWGQVRRGEVMLGVVMRGRARFCTAVLGAARRGLVEYGKVR